MFHKPRRKVDRVFLHCTASDNPVDDNIEVIRQWHRLQGFDDVGYHFMIHKDGRLSYGRSLELTPAAQRGHNVRTISICLHGYKVENFSPAQFATLQTLAGQIHHAYYGRVSFHGHCEVSEKACPIFDYRQVLKLDRYGSFGVGNVSRPSVSQNSGFVRLNYGDRGERVKELQRLLGIPATGIYDEVTLAKVKDFKSQHNLYPSGIVTQTVWELLHRPVLDHVDTNAPIVIENLPELRQGSRGSAVELLQRHLFVTVDGIFGSQVARAVKEFKVRHGLYRSDIVNQYVWKLLLGQNRVS